MSRKLDHDEYDAWAFLPEGMEPKNIARMADAIRGAVAIGRGTFDGRKGFWWHLRLRPDKIGVVQGVAGIYEKTTLPQAEIEAVDENGNPVLRPLASAVAGHYFV